MEHGPKGKNKYPSLTQPPRHRHPAPEITPPTTSASTNPHGSTLPSPRIGEAQRDSDKLHEGPGPGDYNLAASRSGPRITIGSKGKLLFLNDALQPGPGNYNVSTDGVYKNTAAFTMGAKYGTREEDPEPGPGAYTYGKGFKQNGPKMGTSKRAGL